MKKGFPNKILGIFPNGWKFVTEIKGRYKASDNTMIYTVHTYCQTRACIGKENSNLFTYCPACLIKLDEE